MLQKFWKKEGYTTTIKSITEQIDMLMNTPANDYTLMSATVKNLVDLRNFYKDEMKEKGYTDE